MELYGADMITSNISGGQMEPNILNSQKIKNNIYYILVAVVSVIALIFLPMIGSDVDGNFNFPTTAVGWIIYIVQQLVSAIINILIFHSFICQSEINVRDNWYYQEAVRILRDCKDEEVIPMSLEKFRAREYGVKGATIFVSSVLATFAFTQAILSFDYMRLLTYLFVIIGGIIFGIITMKKWEVFYTTTYYDYAIYYQKKKQQEKIEQEKLTNGNKTSEWDTFEHTTGADRPEPGVDNPALQYRESTC